MGREDIPYYIGLDCGTNSVGFAVTDKDYNLIKAGSKDMWGSHLFDEAQTAEARRVQRNARKRLNRQKERIKILQAVFAEEIYKIDPTFFLRLNESSLFVEDRDESNKQKFSLFNDNNYTDKDFKQEYPTIYHLRAALMEGKAKQDPRLVYLALQHIIKNRGHFLFPGEDLGAVQDVTPILQALVESYSVVFEDDELGYDSEEDIKDALVTRKRAERQDKLMALLRSENDSRKKLIVKAMIGYTVAITSLFDNDEYSDLPKLEFSKASFEEQSLPELESNLSEDEYKLVEALKALYDWSLLSSIMAGEVSISRAKIKQYNKNREDLKLLKDVMKEYAPDSFKSFFYETQKGGFSSYIGDVHTNKKRYTDKKKNLERCDTESFYKEIKNILKNADKDDERVGKILEDIENDNFFTLLRSFRNGVIPYQANLYELKQIISSAVHYMPWLDIKDDDGITPADKIIKTMKFRIPYYVGPLTSEKYSKNAWMERKEDGRILPWNFDEKVDKATSAEKFINRMTNKCTYLITEDVVPKQSLLYQKYMVLNEINKLRINDVPVSVEQKQIIFNEFKKGNVTPNKIKKLAVANGWVRKGEECNLSGIDETIKASLSSYRMFSEYLSSGKLTEGDVEDIIRWLTLFSDGGSIIKDKISEAFSNKLSKDEIRRISNLKLSGWGNFSKKFLTGLEAENPETGEITNIMGLLWDTNLNLMEIINSDAIGINKQINNTVPVNSLRYSILDDLRVSPKVKRQIWQALRVVKEIEHVMGHKPEKVFIEVARYEGEKGKRTKSRKDQLLEAVKGQKDEDVKQILKSLTDADSSMITKRDKLYLYYTQLGKCMYSGEPIDLDDLLNESRNYDIDHIYPISKSGDDSLSNKVIVKSTLNREKTNSYPLPVEWQSRMIPFWKKLLKMGLISSEKYHRLTRDTGFSDTDFTGFINRQLVETSQNTVALARILKSYYGEETQIIYSKAGNVSQFRNQFDIYKSRIVNDLHHAKDAYLNIVVGNTLTAKYTDKFFLNKPNFKNEDKYRFNVPGAWVADNGETIVRVKSIMDRNTVLFTRQPEMRTGQLFDLQLVPAGSKVGILPAKMTETLKKQLATSSDKEAVLKKWTDKYGGYNSLSISHFAIIKRLDKKVYKYSFVRIPIIRAKELSDAGSLKRYCEDELHYKEVEVIRSKLLFNSLIIVNGFSFTITGTANGGDILLMKSSIPLLLDNDVTKYVKNLEKYAERLKRDKNLKVDSQYDKITAKENIELYDLLLRKAGLMIYKNRPGSALEVLIAGKEKFEKLSLEEQVSVLINFLQYMGMNNGKADLTLIAGKSGCGTLTVQSSIDPTKKKVVIVDQSITGIYESRIELK